MKFNFLLIILIILCQNLFSQNLPADTSNRVINLDEVVVSANKVTEDKKNVAQQIESISAKQIAQANPQTTADLLQQTGQVLVQKSQLGGGSPILRGFEASRVVLMVDDVRMNNIIYRSGHLQNIITIDPSMLERVEILFGPSSTVYGSDALGGVIHFHTRKPQLSSVAGKSYVNGNYGLRYSSADREKNGHLNFNIGGTKLASLTSVTYSDFDDLVQGKNLNDIADSTWLRPYYVEHISGKDSLIANENIYKQVQSGYSQYDILQKFLFRQNDHVRHLLNLQLSNSSDVPRYDRLTDPDVATVLRNAEWYYGPQFRTLASYELDIENVSGFFTEYRAGINFQSIEESRHQRRFGRTGLQNRNENVNVLGFDLDARKSSLKNDFRLGFDGQVNSLKSTADERDIETGEVSSLDTRYPDGDNRMSNFGLYATHTYHINDQWLLNAGLRLQYISLHSTFVSKDFFDFPFDDVDQSHLPLSGSFGIIRNGKSGLRAALMGSTGFRAPNVDDLAKVFESEPGIVIVPNPGLAPERTYNIDLNLSKTFSNKVKIEAVGFYTLFRDAIVTDAFTLNGDDSIFFNGESSAVFANQNKGKAFLYGASGNLLIDFNDHLSVISTMSYTHGRIVTDTGNAPLDHIPPVIGKTSVIYSLRGFRGEVAAHYNGWKHIEDYYPNGEDNEQYATPEGMPSWWTLNLRLEYKLNKYLTVQAACENIFDSNYRVFASGISAPGRNFITGVRGSF
ncbi:MAG: TonB-dependent receptor [Chitinophagales bacterium]